jgi:hypothetical protein
VATGYIPITSSALVDSLMVGSITASNITNYSITFGSGGNGVTTWSNQWNGNTTTTWASSAATVGNWVTINYDVGSAVEAGRLADQIDPYAGLGSGHYTPRVERDPYRDRVVEGEAPTYRYNRYAGVPTLPPETPEQIERREQLRRERREQWDREHAERREQEQALIAERAAANDRARELLLSLLTDDRRREFETRHTITVVGSAGNLFRLETGFHEGNVSWLDEAGGVRGTMCAHPPRYVDDRRLPLLDVIAGQLLAIIADEPAFVRVANRYSGEMPTYPAPESEVPEPEVTEAELTGEGGMLVTMITDEVEAA